MTNHAERAKALAKREIRYVCSDDRPCEHDRCKNIRSIYRYLDAFAALEEAHRLQVLYREAHDRYGDDHIETGAAWDRMRRASDKALAALNALPGDEDKSTKEIP